jgi:glycosyltransferase involved in cell wall biosynthesis
MNTMISPHHGSRADLHVHSKHSDRPSEWFLRRIGAPESFVEPRAVYEHCRAAGMDFVTLTDHNSIRGAMEIADLPGTFLSSELTTYFPENGCKIHCLVYGITPEQFTLLDGARASIYDLRSVLLEQDIVHSIAHPLFRVNDRLTPELFEKLLVLFNRFEGINGSREPLACRLAGAIFADLTPALLERLANAHGLEPHGPEPWRKHLTGGSDDHGGLYTAAAYTETPEAADVPSFLDHLRHGRHHADGTGGTSLQLASSLLQIACGYYRERFLGKGGGRDTGLIGAMLGRLTASSAPPPVSPWRALAQRVAGPVLRRQSESRLSAAERQLVEEFQNLMRKDGGRSAHDDLPRQRFAFVADMSHQLSYLFLARCLRKLGEGSLIGALESLASLGPVALGVAPYLTAFGAQHKDRAFLRELAARWEGGRRLMRPSGRRAWLTDTFEEMNGVSHSVRTLARLAHEQGRPITVFTCLDQTPEVTYPLRNHAPVGVIHLPEYPSLALRYPPVLNILHDLEEGGYDELIISTPGPLGLCGLLAARLLGIPAKGIYHTDFPRYFEIFTEDTAMGDLATRAMRAFYGRMDRVYAPSQTYVRALEEMGLPPDNLALMTRGVDARLFHPGRRDPEFWDRHGLRPGFRHLYVGRISAEKNLEALFAAMMLLEAEGGHGDLGVVGDGPHLDEYRRRYEKCRSIHFVGRLLGEELATAYASADALVFPSRTDTFGNVVLEAHAAGLPALVSDTGGPREIVTRHASGLVVDTTRPEALARGMRRLAHEPELHARLREGALRCAMESRWEKALDELCGSVRPAPACAGRRTTERGPRQDGRPQPDRMQGQTILTYDRGLIERECSWQ